MTHVYDNPATFAEDALEGLCDVQADLVLRVKGGVVRRHRSTEPRVAVLYGGGSGHYPAFAGLVGHGMGAGAVCGNIFTSPSADDAVHVARAAHSGAGVIFAYGNYAGDVMNFGLATARLRDEGMAVDNLVVTDDIASAPVEEISRRRGIAGDFPVFKIMGAAAERGDSLEEVMALGRRANEATRTMGVAFAGCTMPGATEPLFTLTEGEMGLGLGIHGEPGLADVPLPPARELGDMLVERVLAERPEGHDRAAVMLNGLGRTKWEELFVLWRSVAPALRKAGIEICAPEVGELVTSLDMAGVSLTLTYLDDELEELWGAPALTPAWARGRTSTQDYANTVEADPSAAESAPPREQGTNVSRAAARLALRHLEAVRDVLRDHEEQLGRLDAVAGDGDHGRGMVRGCDAAAEAAEESVEEGAGLGDLLADAGDAWAARAGGTSGVLWGAGLRAAGGVLGNRNRPDGVSVGNAAQSFVDTVTRIGGASPGDKTLLDAAIPWAHTLRELAAEHGLHEAAARAATDAEAGAEATKGLTPQVGRARPLAAKSQGAADPGAVSFALIATTIAAGSEPAARPERTEP